nr:Histidine--tRNA ligase [Chlamydiota bacterium]
LSKESKVRFEKNVLRILDSKDENDQKLLKGAPTIHDFITEEAIEHFQKVQGLLKKLDVQYVLSPNLVRGLDYYTKTVFDVTSVELGEQNTIAAGGRYDGLTALLGGPNLPAVGFATGLERILQTMLGQNVSLPSPPHPQIFLIPLGEKAKEYCTQLVYQLRHLDIATEIDWHPKKVGKSLEKASNLSTTYALVLGDNELSSGEIKLKKLASHEEISLKLEDLTKFLLG